MAGHGHSRDQTLYLEVWRVSQSHSEAQMASELAETAYRKALLHGNRCLVRRILSDMA